MDIFFIEALKGQLVKEVYDLGKVFSSLVVSADLNKRGSFV